MLKLQSNWTKVLKAWGTAGCFTNTPSTPISFLLTEHWFTPLQADNWPAPRLSGVRLHWSKLIMVIVLPLPIIWLATGM